MHEIDLQLKICNSWYCACESVKLPCSSILFWAWRPLSDLMWSCLGKIPHPNKNRLGVALPHQQLCFMTSMTHTPKWTWGRGIVGELTFMRIILINWLVNRNSKKIYWSSGIIPKQGSKGDILKTTSKSNRTKEQKLPNQACVCAACFGQLLSFGSSAQLLLQRRF